MHKSTKFWLLSAASLIVLGSTTFAITGCAIGWDFNKFNTVTLETNTYTISESFQNISIDIDTADITLQPSDNEECKVECHEDVKQKHSVTVENNTLTIQETDDRAWYDHLTVMGDGDALITVYLPQAQYTALSIKTSTGDITVNSAIVDSASLTVSTGDIVLNSVTITNDLHTKASTGDTELKSVTAKNFTHNSSSGEVDMESVLIAEKMSITVSTGSVEFERCDAGEIYIKTTTGDVEGSLLTSKDFHADSNTGDKKVPQSSGGGKCEISCSTGDIKITVINE